MSDSLLLNLGSGVSGTPLTPQFASNLTAALAGGQATSDFFTNLSAYNNFFQWLAMNGESSWISDTDANGNTFYFAVQKSPQQTIQLLIQALPDSAAINGETKPTIVTVNGQPSAIAGSMIATLTNNDVPQWKLSAAIDLSDHVTLDVLQDVAWDTVCQPLLSTLAGSWIKMLNGELSQAERFAQMGPDAMNAYLADLSDAERAEAEAAAQSIPIDAGTIFLGAGLTICLVGLVLLPGILDAIEHVSCQNVLIYNTTSYNVSWSIGYQDEGACIIQPLNADGSPNYSLPPVISSGPGDPDTTPMASSATLGFTSDSSYNGISYVLTFALTDSVTGSSVGGGGVMFDIPLSGQNSISVTATAVSSPQEWCQNQEGVNNVIQAQATSSNNTFSITATFDFLTGEHPGPSGLNSFFYNSLIAIQPVS